MKAQPNRSEDRKYLQKLSEALDTSEGRIKLDECGDWNIFGRKGKISTETKYWYLYVVGNSKRHWSAIKTKLKFMIVSQDGDGEGILKLDRMPTSEEAESVREVVGLNKKPTLTDERRASLKIQFKSPGNKGV